MNQIFSDFYWISIHCTSTKTALIVKQITEMNNEIVLHFEWLWFPQISAS
jgi:hypothetical protein